MTNRAELDAIIAATCPRCATDRHDCTCPGGLRSRSLAEVFATATGWTGPQAATSPNPLIGPTRGRP